MVHGGLTLEISLGFCVGEGKKNTARHGVVKHPSVIKNMTSCNEKKCKKGEILHSSL